MTNNPKGIITTETDDWRPKVIAIGGAIGAVLGVVSALLYIRSAEETGTTEAPEPPGTSDAVRMGISLMSIIRTVTEWPRK